MMGKNEWGKNLKGIGNWKFLLIFFLMFGCTVQGVGSVKLPLWGYWQPLAILIILICYFAISIVYMVGRSFGMPTLVGWAKAETVQVTATAFLLAAIVLLVAFIDFEMFPALNSVYGNTRVLPDDKPITAPNYDDPGSDHTVFDEARAYLGSRAIVITRFFSLMFIEYSWIAMLAGTSMNLRLGSLGGGAVQVFQFYKVIIDVIQTVLKLISGAVTLYFSQYIMLSVVEKSFLQVFLPLGLGMRCFSFTRKIGGAFIAIALGFYIFYPLMFLMNNVVTYDFFYAKADGSPEKGAAICKIITPKILEDEEGSDAVSPISMMDSTIVAKAMDILGKGGATGMGSAFMALYFLRNKMQGFVEAVIIWSIAVSLVSSGLTINSIQNAFTGLPGQVTNAFLYCPSYIVVVVCVLLPILNIFLTLSIVRNMGLVIGTDISLRSIMKFI